ncbi:MAG: Mut7-C RNAse domain-containing protein [bacterium]
MNMPDGKQAFVVDRMLGGLAKWLRVVGFDTLYDSKYTRNGLIKISLQTGRIIITRDTWFETQPYINAIVLHDNYTIGQLKELFSKHNVNPVPERFFTRCIVCNSELVNVTKEEVKDSVPAFVLSTHDAFSKCPVCKRVFWGGTHKENMLKTLKIVLS